jgi:hypothetical protein
VSLLLNSTDGANTIGNINTTANGYITTGRLSVNNQLLVNATGNNAAAEVLVDGNGSFSGDFAVGGNTTLPNAIIGTGTISVLDVNSFTQTSITPSNFLGNVITSEFFIGNGYYLTGVGNGGGGGSGSSISNGTSNVSVAPNGNVTVTISGGLVTTFATTGISVVGNVRGSNLNTGGIVSATGNVLGSYFIGNGSALTGITATTVGVLPSLSVTGTTQTGNLLTGGVVSAVGNITAANYNTSGLISAAGAVSAAGNIVSGQFFVGNGSALTGIVATGVGTLPSLSVTGNIVTGNLNTAGLVSTTGNIAGNNLSLIGLATVAGNLTVGGVINLNNINTAGSIEANYLQSNTAVLAGTYMSAAGNITGNLFFANSVTSTGNVSGSNLVASANVVASGDLSSFGNVWLSPGAGPASTNKGIYWVGSSGGIYRPSGSDSNTTFQMNNMTVTGIGEGGNILVGNVQAGQTVSGTTVSATGNVLAGGRVSATGNITGGNVTGPSSTVAFGIVNYKDYFYNIGSVSGTVTIDPANGSIQQVTLTGNITVNQFYTPQVGQSVVIKFIQDGTGNRQLSSTMKWAGGNKTLSTAANAVDIASIFYDGTTYWASLTLAYA